MALDFSRMFSKFIHDPGNLHQKVIRSFIFDQENE